MSLKLLYVWNGGASELPPHPSELLHLNQAGVKYLISNLTYAHNIISREYQSDNPPQPPSSLE